MASDGRVLPIPSHFPARLLPVPYVPVESRSHHMKQYPTDGKPEDNSSPLHLEQGRSPPRPYKSQAREELALALRLSGRARWREHQTGFADSPNTEVRIQICRYAKADLGGQMADTFWPFPAGTRPCQTVRADFFEML